MDQVIHHDNEARSTVPASYDCAFILREAGNPNHAGFMDGDGGTKTIVYHPNDHEMMITIIDDYAARHLEKVAKPLLSEKVTEQAALVFAAGFTLHEGGHPLDGHTLQVRDVEDRTNWLTSQAAYQAAIVDGQGDVTGANFRTAANQVITCTFAQGHAALLAMAAWGAAIMEHSWSLKDAAAEALDADALASIDITSGWPA